MSNVSLFRRYEAAQEAMLRSTMPKSGIVEYINLLPQLPLTGRRWTVSGALVMLSSQGVSLARTARGGTQ